MKKRLENLQIKWEKILLKMEQKGADIHPFHKEDNATEAEIVKKEDELGVSIPPSYRQTLLHFSKALSWRSSFPEQTILPEVFNEIFACEINWDINELEDLTLMADEDYGEELRNKLAFTHAGNGDIYAFDMNVPGDEKPVVYWNHETGEITRLADSFIDFLEKITALGAPGNELWQFEYFIEMDGLNVDSDISKAWLKWFNEYLH